MRRRSRPRRSRAAALVAALVAAPLLLTGPPAAADHQWAPVVVALRDTSGAVVGTVVLTPTAGRTRGGTNTPNGLGISATVFGLTPGFHGFHVHEKGVCDAENGFAGAGGHYVFPTSESGRVHGQHAGDLPSLPDTGALSTSTDMTLNGLLDHDGSAFVVHAGPDNFANIPDRYSPDPDETTLATGDSGGRVACGVVAPLAAVLSPGESLRHRRGVVASPADQDRLVSPGGAQFVVQTDGNVVVYGHDRRPRFATSTTTVVWLAMQADGNLVAYDAEGRAVWFQYGEPGATLRIQDDANAVLYAPSGRALWSSTYGRVG